MIRIALLVLVALLPVSAYADNQSITHEYFLVCNKETDMFVLMHTWEYYGYDAFLNALDYYQNEKAYGELPACVAFAGTVGPIPLKTTLYGETEFLFQNDTVSVYMTLYLWDSETDDGVFQVLSTTLPPE